VAHCARVRKSSSRGGRVEAQTLARCAGVRMVVSRPAEAGDVRDSDLPVGLVPTGTGTVSETICTTQAFHQKRFVSC
jgi:hypothetical protein